MVRDEINLATFSYALTVFSENFIKMDDGRCLELSIQDSLFLETLLCQIRGEVIRFSKKLAKSERQLENTLFDEITCLEEKLVFLFLNIFLFNIKHVKSAGWHRVQISKYVLSQNNNNITEYCMVLQWHT